MGAGTGSNTHTTPAPHAPLNRLRRLGAKIVPVGREQGGFTGSIRMAEELAAKEGGIFLPRQFSNVANVEAHEQTTELRRNSMRWLASE
jgi:cysteine synthase